MICPNCGVDWIKPRCMEEGIEPKRDYHCHFCGMEWSTREVLAEVRARQVIQATLYRLDKKRTGRSVPAASVGK